MTLRIVGMMVAFAAVAVTMVLVPAAVPTSGDSPGTTGAPTGGGTAGGGDGLTVPGGDAQASNLWSANIGGTTTSGLDTSDIGRVLYRGTKRLIQTQSPTGDGATVEVCEGFPEITVSQSGASSGPGVDGIKLRLDFAACAVYIGELTRTSVGVDHPGDSRSRGPGAFSPSHRPYARNTSIAWFKPRTESGESVDVTHGLPRFGRLWGSLEDWVQRDLTKVEVSRTLLKNPLRTTGFAKYCRTDSPFEEQIRWYNDECLGGHQTVAGQERAWARGRFHAEVQDAHRGTTLHGDSRHTIYIRLQGDASADQVRSCTFSPYNIRRLRATFSKVGIFTWWLAGPYGVTVDCRYRYHTLY